MVLTTFTTKPLVNYIIARLQLMIWMSKRDSNEHSLNYRIEIASLAGADFNHTRTCFGCDRTAQLEFCTLAMHESIVDMCNNCYEQLKDFIALAQTELLKVSHSVIGKCEFTYKGLHASCDLCDRTAHLMHPVQKARLAICCRCVVKSKIHCYVFAFMVITELKMSCDVCRYCQSIFASVIVQ